MATNFPYFMVQELTDTGAPAVGYLLYTYESGTTTPLETWTDAAATTLNANPIVLDAGGRCTIFGGTSAYTFVLKTPGGATVWTRDSISAIPVASATSFVPIAGGVTMTGLFSLSGNATANLHPAPLQQVNSLIAAAIASEVTARNSAITAAVAAEAALRTAADTAIGPTGTVGASSSLTFQGGLIVKWGTTGSITGDTADNTVTFPVAFPNACHLVLVSPATNNGVSGGEGYSIGAHSKTTTNFKINNDSTTTTVAWLAIGN